MKRPDSMSYLGQIERQDGQCHAWLGAVELGGGGSGVANCPGVVELVGGDGSVANCPGVVELVGGGGGTTWCAGGTTG